MKPFDVVNTREFLSKDEIGSVVETLRQKPAFAGFDAEALAVFVKNCEVVKFGPHEVVWRKGEGHWKYFMVLLEGCLAAWGDIWDEASVDALVTKGHLFGEAELFGFETTCRELVTLMRSRILVAPTKYVGSLLASEQGPRFYEGLSVSLIEKLRAQNYLLKVRTGQNERRLVKFLDNFSRDPGWRDLTSIKGKFQKDNFRINLFFNADLISGLLCSVSRQIAPVVKNFIEWDVIRMFEVDRNFSVSSDPVSADRFPKSSFPDFPYFQLELLDHRQLMRVLDGTK
jgi:hypothetical protein